MINVRFLGTGTIGDRPRNKLSKEYRRFSTLLVGEKILIDPSIDIFEFQESFQVGGIFDGARDIFITHSHPDHFSASAIERLAECGPVNVYGSSYIGEGLGKIPGVTFHEITPFMKLSIGDLDIIPLPANHLTENAGEVVLNYLIMGEKNIFYGCDGAFINARAFELLKEIKLNLCILECTLTLQGYCELSVTHNNLDAVKNIREIFLNTGCADESTKFIITHIPTVKRRAIGEELIEAIGDYPIRVAYDGYYIGI